MGHRNPVRFLAPLALVAALVGVIAVVQASRPDSGDSGRTTTTAAKSAPQRRGGGQRRRAQSRVYVVRAGDSLSVISERTGVAIERIQQLNPDVDTQTLTVGQRLRLR